MTLSQLAQRGKFGIDLLERRAERAELLAGVRRRDASRRIETAHGNPRAAAQKPIAMNLKIICFITVLRTGR